MTEVPVDEECRDGGTGALPFPAFLRPGCSLLHPGAPRSTRGALCSAWVLPAPARCSMFHPGCLAPPRVLPALPEVLCALLRCSLLYPRCSPLHLGVPHSIQSAPCSTQGAPCSIPSAPHSTLGAPSSPSSAPGLALRVHRVGWPPQGSVGPVLMLSLGAGRRNRPELPHVSAEGQHGL